MSAEAKESTTRPTSEEPIALGRAERAIVEIARAIVARRRGEQAEAG